MPERKRFFPIEVFPYLKYMDNFDHRSILVDSGSIVHCSNFWKREQRSCTHSNVYSWVPKFLYLHSLVWWSRVWPEIGHERQGYDFGMIICRWCLAFLLIVSWAFPAVFAIPLFVAYGKFPAIEIVWFFAQGPMRTVAEFVLISAEHPSTKVKRRLAHIYVGNQTNTFCSLSSDVALR